MRSIKVVFTLLLLFFFWGTSLRAPEPWPAAYAATDSPPTAPAPTKLELSAPEKVQAGSGYVKVTTKAKLEVAWDVFAVFADPDIKVQSDVIDGVLIVGIPGSAGAIRVTAAGIINGKPVLASVIINVEAKEDAPKGSGVPPPGTPRLHVTVIGLPESAGLRKGLEEAGLRYWPYQQVPANRPDLAKQTQKVGVPCVIVQTPDGKVVKAAKIASENDVVNEVNSVGK